MQSAKSLTVYLVGLVSLAIIIFSPVANAASAKDALEAECSANPDSSLCAGYNNPENPGSDNDGILAGIVNILSYAAGALAIIFVIYGGFKYAKSGGDGNSVSEAKNTIIYALVGIIVVVLARYLILFVLSKL